GGGDVVVALVGGVDRGDSNGDGGRQWWWRSDGVELSQRVVAVEMAVVRWSRWCWWRRGDDGTVGWRVTKRRLVVGGSGGDDGRQWWWRSDGVELSQPVAAVEMAVAIVVRWLWWCWWRRGDDGSMGWRVAKRRQVAEKWPEAAPDN
nr:hypothetical protein [Tanacetum cinerariifolium]